MYQHSYLYIHIYQYTYIDNSYLHIIITDGVKKQESVTPVIFAPLKKVKKTVIIEKDINEKKKKRKVI
jgi:hypothetical protein